MEQLSPTNKHTSDLSQSRDLHSWLLIAAIAVVGCLATLSISYTSYDYVRRTTIIESQSRITEIVRQVKSEFNNHISSVRAFRALFDTTGDITKDSFSSFASSLRASGDNALAYGWAPKIIAENRQEYVEKLHALGFDSEGFVYDESESASARKFSIVVIEPNTILKSLYGHDLAAMPSISGIIQDSIDFNEARLSDPLNNIEGYKQNGLVMLLLPQYEPGAKNFLVDQRRENVIGIIFAILNLKDFFNFAFQSITSDELAVGNTIAVNMKANDNIGEAGSIFRTQNFDTLIGKITGNIFNPIIKSDQAFYLGNRPIHIQMLVDISAFGLSKFRATIATLIIGGALTLIACFMVYMLFSREKQVKALVVDRTKALRRSEERFRDMADVSADWFWEMDASLRFTYLSERFEDVSGLQKELFINRTRSEAAGVDVYDIDDSWRAHLNDLEHHRNFSDFRYTMPQGNGRKKYFSISGKPIFDADGAFLGYRGTGRDVTVEERAQIGLRESEARLQRYVEELEVSRQYLEENTAEMAELAERYAIEKERAEASEKSKSEFLASMSHEIRTPMTGVMGFADMLLDSRLDAEDRDKVIKIKGATQSLLSIINDILDLSKLEAGRVEIENIDFNLRTVIEEVLDLVGERARMKNIGLKVDYPGDIPDGINGDPTRIRQILINLIGNAVKFTHSGGITVAVRLEGNEHVRALRVSVIDTGIGISKENSENLFSDFSQADASISRRYEGTGLGLSISKRLVDLMDGSIGVESDEGKGSEFFFRIPYRAVTSDVSVQARQNIVQSFSTIRPLNILVAEDNKLNQRIIMATLDKYGHRSTIVENGEQAVAEVGNDQYDLILMDIRMPEMSGPEATRAIRARTDELSKIPIIALTADAMEEHIRGYLADGMDACATKPIDRIKLLTIINEVLGEEIHVPVMESREKSDVDKAKISISHFEHASAASEIDTSSVLDFLDTVDNIANEIERVKGTKS